MMKIHICSSLSERSLPSVGEGMLFWGSRKLSADETNTIRAHRLNRYYLKQLDADETRAFFQVFDQWWDRVIQGREPNDPFWRNALSSKMQEWENSAAYLALVLFTISKDKSLEGKELIVLPDNVEEAVLWRSWALASGWTVGEYGFGSLQKMKQEAENIVRSLRLSVIFMMKKWRALPVASKPRPGAFLIMTVFYRRVLGEATYDDQFFGKLHEDIQQQGKDAFYLGDAIDELQEKDIKQVGQHGKPTSIYSFVSWSEVFAGLWKVLAQRPRFVDCKFEGVDFSRFLTWHARRARYEYNLTAEFFYRAVRKASQQFQFGKMLFAFEGNAYERACIQAFRETTPSAPIDGYGHGVIYPLNLKLYLTPLEATQAPEPDRYLVSGDYAEKAFREVRRSRSPVAKVCFLRNIPRRIEKDPALAPEVLIVLDGIWSTTNWLNWFYQHQDILKDYKVTVRAHPNVSGERLLSQCPYYRDGVFNISERSLDEDLRHAACVIYRQSSVGVMALMNSTPIIHTAIDLPLDADPLKNLKAGKLFVTNENGLREALSHINELSAELRKDPSKGLDVAQNYFVAPSDEFKKVFLEAVR